MCFYLPYGTWAISHALGLANGGSGQITVVMLIGAVCVTGVIIGFDALIISYIAVNANDLDDSEAPPVGKLSKAMIGLRLVIAVVMVGVFTIPTLLFFFQRETTADLAAQNQRAIASYVAHGPPAQIQAQINKLTNQETSDPNFGPGVGEQSECPRSGKRERLPACAARCGGQRLDTPFGLPRRW